MGHTPQNVVGGVDNAHEILIKKAMVVIPSTILSSKLSARVV